MIKGTYKSERKETNSLIGYGNSKVLKFLLFFFFFVKYSDKIYKGV